MRTEEEVRSNISDFNSMLKGFNEYKFVDNHLYFRGDARESEDYTSYFYGKLLSNGILERDDDMMCLDKSEIIEYFSTILDYHKWLYIPEYDLTEDELEQIKARSNGELNPNEILSYPVAVFGVGIRDDLKSNTSKLDELELDIDGKSVTN